MWIQALPKPSDFTSFAHTEGLDDILKLELFPKSLDFIFEKYPKRQIDGRMLKEMVRYAYRHAEGKIVSVEDCIETLRTINLQTKLAESSSFATTHDVRITTTTFYSPSESHELAHRFYYRIFIENQGADTVTLRSRHWRFTSDKNFTLEDHTGRMIREQEESAMKHANDSADGQSGNDDSNSGVTGVAQASNRSPPVKKTQVRAWDIPDMEDGSVMEVPKWAPGVVGEMPILPQGKAFQYLSSCILRYPTGKGELPTDVESNT
jgi:uncharacterized protein affecting Mg2+/Co2+ transport